MITAVSALVAAAFAAPPFFQKSEGADVARMVKRGINVVSQLSADVGGDHAAERIVLLGEAGTDGVVSVTGIAALDTSSGLRVLDSVRLPTNPSYSVTFGSAPVDLDGDGKVEVALDTVASEAGLFRFEDTLFVSLQAGKLRVVYTLARQLDRPPVSESRTFERVSPGVLEETVKTRDAAGERLSVQRVTFDPDERRFVR